MSLLKPKAKIKLYLRKKKNLRKKGNLRKKKHHKIPNIKKV